MALGRLNYEHQAHAGERDLVLEHHFNEDEPPMIELVPVDRRDVESNSGSSPEGCADFACQSETDTAEEDAKDKSPGALNDPWVRVGFYCQYFAVGIIYGGLPAMSYGFFLGYMNVPAYVYATASVINSLPWSFKFFFGFINDTVPIRGLRRKPYMILGWCVCTAVLIVLWFQHLPPPYWCIDERTGRYIKKVEINGTTHAAVPCNPSARSQGGHWAFLMMFAALGYVIADVASDGLLVQYARLEPAATRGTTQTMAYFTRTVGSVCASLLVGFGMSSKLYNGSFDFGFSFTTMCGILAIPAAIMVPVTALLIKEPVTEGRHTCIEYRHLCWELLSSQAFFWVVLYCLLFGAISGVSTTAGGLVKNYWANVESFQNQLFSLTGSVLFAAGLFLVKKYFLHASWRKMICFTTIWLNCVDMIFTTLTTFNIVRNQYFYLGEAVLIEVPAAASFVVSTYVMVEMADGGNEGLVYGLLTTASNLGNPFAQALSNQIFGAFPEDLSDPANYIADTSSFRMQVFISFVVSYAFSFIGLLTLFFLPWQKEEAQHRKKTWSKDSRYAIATLCLLGFCFSYSITVNFLSMFPSTMCLKVAGGAGC